MFLFPYLSKHLRRRAALLLVAYALGGCAAQRFNSDGQRQIDEGQVGTGLASLREAMRLDPDNLRYRLDYVNRLGEETKKLIRRGEELRAAGDTGAARAAFLAALQLDNSNERARRGVSDIDMDIRHRDILAEAEKMIANGKWDTARERTMVVLLDNPANPHALLLMRKIVTEVDTQQRAKVALTASQSVLKKPVSLQFRDASLRMVFEALSRTTGLNVILDRDVRPDLKTTIFVRDGSVEDTVNLILLQNQLEKKVLNVNTMFIYPATAAKQKEYQELKVRTFHISNGDAKYILTVLKSVLKIKDVLVDERTNTLVLRDTPEALEVAAKVIAAHDLVDAEVMLEVEVLEISRDRLTGLGIKWPDGATISTPSGGAAGALTLGALRNLTRDQLLVTPLSLGLNFKLQDTDANLLASPRIRVRDHEKAKILIGDKVPIITNSATPLATGASVVTGSIQYIDVGIKLEAEPHVYPEGEVGIKLNLEVSNIVKQIEGPSGSLAYQIGTRSASTSLRLRDGETQVLGGLISNSDRTTASKVPGVGQLPVLGRLFSDHNGDNAKTEIVLSITPRIVRAQGIAEATMRDVWSGTETTIHSSQLRLDPISSVSGTSSGASSGASSGGNANPQTTAAGNASTAVAPVPAAGPPPSTTPSNQNGAVSVVPAAPAPQPPGPLVNPAPLFPPDGVYQPAPVPAPLIPAPAKPIPLNDSVALPPENVLAAATPAAAMPGAGVAAAQGNNEALVVAAVPAAAGTAAGGSGQAANPPPAKIASAVAANSAGSHPQITWGKPDSIRAGDQFKVALNAANFDGIRSLPLAVRYDPRILSFVEASPGEASTRVGVGALAPEINDAAGRVNVTLTADTGKFFTGSGELLNLTFSARNSSKQTQMQVQLAQVDIRGGGALRAITRPQPLMLKIEP